MPSSSARSPYVIFCCDMACRTRIGKASRARRWYSKSPNIPFAILAVSLRETIDLRRLIQARFLLSRCRLIPHRQPITSARIRCAQTHAGLLFDHDSFSVAEVARLREFVTPREQGFLGIT